MQRSIALVGAVLVLGSTQCVTSAVDPSLLICVPGEVLRDSIDRAPETSGTPSDCDASVSQDSCDVRLGVESRYLGGSRMVVVFAQEVEVALVGTTNHRRHTFSLTRSTPNRAVIVGQPTAINFGWLRKGQCRPPTWFLSFAPQVRPS